MLDGSRTTVEIRGDAAPSTPDRGNGSWSGAPTVDVGLVNNMPDAVFARTERQFDQLLQEAARGQIKVRLHLLAIPEVARGKTASLEIADRYRDVSDLARMNLDALIVTGAEPKARLLSDEPYWAAMTRLIDWAENNVSSAIWSCLAAHAAVKHLDNIDRRPVGAKCFGVFDCEVELRHSLVAGLAETLCIPHSRYNELAEDDLLRAGYSILTRSKLAGIDMFTKKRQRSMFVFFQGHPEYDPASLWREYRRDIARFLAGERNDYPKPPHNYLTADDMRECQLFEAQATAFRHPDLIPAIPEKAEAARQSSSWRPSAVLIYRNWLKQVANLQRTRVSAQAMADSR
jgi:homoserine O-succinyltransferase/O-acetyltransferase